MVFDYTPSIFEAVTLHNICKSVDLIMQWFELSQAFQTFDNIDFVCYVGPYSELLDSNLFDRIRTTLNITSNYVNINQTVLLTNPELTYIVGFDNFENTFLNKLSIVLSIQYDYINNNTLDYCLYMFNLVSVGYLVFMIILMYGSLFPKSGRFSDSHREYHLINNLVNAEKEVTSLDDIIVYFILVVTIIFWFMYVYIDFLTSGIYNYKY